MLALVTRTWPLFFGVFLLLASNGLLVTLLSLRATELGFSETEIGIMQACYPAAAILGCIFAPRLVARVGHVRSFGALASLCSVAAIVHLLTEDVWSWAAMRGLTGFCYPGLFVVAESWLNAEADNRTRGSVLSVYFVVVTASLALGQVMVGIPDPSGTMLFGLTSIMVSLSLVPLLMSGTLAPVMEVPERLAVRDLYRISPMAMIGLPLNSFVQAALYVAVPLYALASGLSAATSGLLLMTGTIAGAVAQYPVGWLSDRMDRRLVIAAGSGVGALACWTIATGVADGVIFLAMACFAGAALPVYSILIAHANDLLRPAQIVPASGTLTMVNYFGVLAGALGGPMVMGWAGPDALFLLMGAVLAASTVLALVRVVRSAAPEDTGAAVPIAPQATQQAARLNPEAEPMRRG